MWAVLGACCYVTLRCTSFASCCSAAAATEWGEPGRPVGQKGRFTMTLLLWGGGDNLGAAAAAADHPIISVLRILRCLSS